MLIYLLWPLGKSVKIDKRRAYVYSEHKSSKFKIGSPIGNIFLSLPE